jgi:hypothetical protein
MSKISVDEVQSTLEDNKLEPDKVAKIISDLNRLIEELKGEKVPNQKSEFFILVDNSEGKFDGLELVGWVGTVPKGGDLGLVVSKIQDAAKDYNATTKAGAKNPVKTISEAIAFVKRKFFKAKEVTLKVKEPVRVLITSNSI